MTPSGGQTWKQFEKVNLLTLLNKLLWKQMDKGLV